MPTQIAASVKKVTTKLKQRLLTLEVFKTLKNLNPIYMNENELKPYPKFLTDRSSNIAVNISSTFINRTRSLRHLGPNKET